MPSHLSIRIQNIQKQLKLSPAGILDLQTCQALEARLEITTKAKTLTAHIKAVQRALKLNADGIAGPMTISRIEALISPKLPPIPAGASLAVSQKGLDMLLAAEAVSREVYNKKYQSPTWPGGDSGVTIGIGYDLGYCSKQDLHHTWQEYLDEKELNALSATCGKKGPATKLLLPGLSFIKIPYDTALHVFYTTTLPECARDVKNTYPGVEKLPPDAQAALLSLVYNRGPLVNDTDRRREMKALVPLVAAGNLEGIAEQIRHMKRLWDIKKQKGLITRRETEAKLAEGASFDVLPEDIVIV